MEKKSQPQLTKQQNLWMAVKFVLFSASAGMIEFGAFFLLNRFTNLDRLTGLDEIFGNEHGLTYFIALFLSVLWNFTLNRKFTFLSATNVPVAMLKVLAFYLVFAPLSIWWTVQLTDRGVNEYLVLIGTMLVNLSTEFFYHRFVVFRNSLYTNKEGLRARGEDSPKH